MRSSLLTVVFLASVVFSQTVNITGTVTSGGQPIQGAVVKLFVQAAACTSKADGSYSLGGEVATIGGRSLGQANGFSYKNKSFVFTAAEPVPAGVKLYDPAGRLVANVFAGNLRQGETRIFFPLDRIGHSILIAHVTLGAKTTTYTLTPLSGKSFAFSTPSLTAGKLSKALAVTDWLQGSKAGYASSIQQISSYTGVINITLSALTAPDFGTNVKVFDPTMAMSAITSTMSSFTTSQFGTNRVAWLFKPGSYSLTVTCDYYIQALGLGISPDSVKITGAVQNTAGGLGAFWRGAENMSVTPTGGSDMWAVSQAAPFRRMHVLGNLSLSNGSASGGYISDSKIDGTVSSGAQQQFYTRNSVIGGWNGGEWNMFFQGVTGAPADNWPSGVINVVAQTPLIREKPFLICDAAGNYSVFVPALRTNAGGGVTWASGAPAGESIPIDQFYIAQAATDNSATINAALAQGKNLLLTPGIYSLSAPIQVVRPNTVVLGIGLATLTPSANISSLMHVADVDGVKIGGILFEADGFYVPVLLQVGDPGSTADHTANPTFVFDIFSREGGSAAGKDSCAVILNSNNAVLDHCWLWRADHGNGVGWTSNPSQTGLVVNGNNSMVYGQFVEHHQQYQTIWNGDSGKSYFYQCEMPYDVPNQAAFNHDGINGWASYKVGNSVTTFQAWGIGIYAYCSQAAILVDHAIETPAVPGVQFNRCFTFSLSGNLSTISNVVNNYGGVCNTAHGFTKITTYVGGQ